MSSSSRIACLALVAVGLAAAPGCSSCLGGSSCRRPSFMEFRSPCRRQADPCMVHEAPACGPVCGPACGGASGESFAPTGGSGPCCGQGEVIYSSPMSAPMSAPMSMPGSMSPAEGVPAPAATPPGTFS